LATKDGRGGNFAVHIRGIAGFRRGEMRQTPMLHELAVGGYIVILLCADDALQKPPRKSGSFL